MTKKGKLAILAFCLIALFLTLIARPGELDSVEQQKYEEAQERLEKMNDWNSNYHQKTVFNSNWSGNHAE